MVAAAGKGEVLLVAPAFGSVVNKFGVVIAVRLSYGKKGGGFEVR
jgi:hypothetical protein